MGEEGGGDGVDAECCWRTGVGEEDRQIGRGGMVIRKMHKPLSCHSLPFSESGEPLGSRAAPEHDVFLFCPGRVVEWGRGVGRGRVDGFVDVVPGGRVADVGIARSFGLGEYRVEGVGGFEGSGGEVEAVEVGEVGLVAGGGGEGPVGEEDSLGVRGCAGGAEGAGVPVMGAAGGGGGRAGYGAVGVEGVEEGLVGERVRVVVGIISGDVPALGSLVAEFIDEWSF